MSDEGFVALLTFLFWFFVVSFCLLWFVYGVFLALEEDRIPENKEDADE